MLSYFYHMIEFDHDHSEFIYHEMCFVNLKYFYALLMVYSQYMWWNFIFILLLLIHFRDG